MVVQDTPIAEAPENIILKIKRDGYELQP